MNSTDREQLRLSLLRFLDAKAAAGNRGLTIGLLLQMARAEGLPDLAAGEVTAELQYLSDKNLVALVGKMISPENAAWRITADGRDQYAQMIK